MPITLTCACGQKQFVANELAGGTTACVACGRTLTVPAMGKLVTAAAPPPPKAKPARKPRRSLVPAFLIASAALALLGAASFLAYAIIERNKVVEQTPITQNEPIQEAKRQPEPSPIVPVESKNHIVPVQVERKRPESEKKSPQVIEPAPPGDVKEPPQVVEPVKPSDPPKAVVEPVKPKDPPPVAKKPVNVIEPLRLVWKLKQEEVFYQELIVTQKPTYKVQGLPIQAFLQYRIVSRLTVTKRNEDGSLVVEQKVESAKLLQADDLTRPSIEPAVGKMAGTVYTMHLSPKMDVTKFEGAAAGINLAQLAGGLGLQMTSLIDRDGWRELNQSTFFQLDDTPKVNARWSKPLTHAWGSMGSWNGQTHYQYLGKEKDLHKVTYALQLAYKAPQPGAAGLMAVNGANFQAPAAGGVILFDANRGRVIAAEERFRVKGAINVNLLGQNTGVEIDEDQHFLIRIHDKIAN